MRRLIVLVLTALALTACGGSSKGLSHAELLRKVDAICASAHERQRAIPDPETNAEIAPILTRQLASARQELASLEAVEPSSQDAQGYARLVSGFRDTLTLVMRVRDQAAAKEWLRVRVLAQVAESKATETRAVATGLGLQVCSRPAG